jgi:hypothetical protein
MILLVATTGPPFVGGTKVAELDIDDIDVEDAEEKAVAPDN